MKLLGEGRLKKFKLQLSFRKTYKTLNIILGYAHKQQRNDLKWFNTHWKVSDLFQLLVRAGMKS